MSQLTRTASTTATTALGSIEGLCHLINDGLEVARNFTQTGVVSSRANAVARAEEAAMDLAERISSNEARRAKLEEGSLEKARALLASSPEDPFQVAQQVFA
jgi:hypothetical protein